MSKPTEAELEVLQVLWEKGACTVKQVHEALAKNKEVGYTTTLKIMQNMYDKKLLSREPAGRSHIYTAMVSEEATQQKLLDRFLKSAFGGSAMKLVMQALGNHQPSKEEIESIKALLEQKEKEKK